jgi:hypothetical protein
VLAALLVAHCLWRLHGFAGSTPNANKGQDWKERPKNPGTRTLGNPEGLERGGSVLASPRDIPTLAELGELKTLLQ